MRANVRYRPIADIGLKVRVNDCFSLSRYGAEVTKLCCPLLLLLALATPAHAEELDYLKEVPELGAASLDATIKGHRVSATLLAGPAPSWWPEWLAVGGLSDDNPSRSHLEDLSVIIDGKKIYVPKDTFAPLFFVHTASLTPSRKGFTLTIYGSENAEVYSAEFAFDFEIMDLREFVLNQPTGYGDEERRVYDSGIWECEKEAKVSGDKC